MPTSPQTSAATPTAAATLATPDGREVAASVAALQFAAAQQLSQQLTAARQSLGYLAHRVQRAAPDRRLADYRQQVDDLRLRRAGMTVASSTGGSASTACGSRWPRSTSAACVPACHHHPA